jgi:large subunit ribosomal protein L25
MKRVSMSGSLRENVGKKDAKAQRKAGNIVCVLYGGKDQISFTVPEQKFEKIIFTPEVYVIDLDIDGKKYASILKEVQYHPVSDSILHADFLQIVEDKPFTVSIPVRITGTAPGIIAGGKLVQKLRKVSLKGLVNDIPEALEVNVGKLKIGMSIRVKDININNIALLDNPSSVIVGVKTARGVVAGEEAEESEEGTESAETSESAE